MTALWDKESEYYARRFEKIDAAGIDILNKEFDSCTFFGCDFSETIFRKCKFVDCDFVDCNLSVVKIELSRFIDVTFTGCKMPGVDWNKAYWPNMALCSPIRFYKCIINDSSFFGLSLKELIIEESKAYGVDFREGDFSRANFTYTDLSGSLFGNTNLSEADFSEAVGYDVDISRNVISKAKFTRYEAVRLLESLGVELVD